MIFLKIAIFAYFIPRFDQTMLCNDCATTHSNYCAVRDESALRFLRRRRNHPGIAPDLHLADRRQPPSPKSTAETQRTAETAERDNSSSAHSAHSAVLSGSAVLFSPKLEKILSLKRTVQESALTVFLGC